MLDIEHLGIHDDFFQLGGDSILATQLISRMRETLHIEVSLPSFFETSTVVGMAKSIETARQGMPSLKVLPLQPMPRDGPLPLSYAQQRLWFLDQLEPGSPTYNLSIALRLTGVLDVFALEKSLDEIVRRHEILRTIFPAQDGQPVQVIVPAFPLTLLVEDLRAIPDVMREAEVQQAAAAESWPNRPLTMVVDVLNCEREAGSYMLPLGVLRLNDRLYWLAQFSGWGHERYVVLASGFVTQTGEGGLAATSTVRAAMAI